MTRSPAVGASRAEGVEDSTGGGPSGGHVLSSRMSHLELAPPVAARRPHAVVSPHGTRERSVLLAARRRARVDADVLAYLEAENAYTEAVLAPDPGSSRTRCSPSSARGSRRTTPRCRCSIAATGTTCATRPGSSTRSTRGAQGTLDAAEEILLDGNAARRSATPSTRSARTTSAPTGGCSRGAEDTVGRNQFVLRDQGPRDRRACCPTPPPTSAARSRGPTTTGRCSTAARTRSRCARIACSGTCSAARTSSSTTSATARSTSAVGATKSHRYITIGMRSTTSSEVLLIDADQPDARAARVPPALEGSPVRRRPPRRALRRPHERQGEELPRRRGARRAQEADRAAWQRRRSRTGPTRSSRASRCTTTFLAASVRTGGLRKVQVLPAKQPAFFIDAQDPAYAMTVLDTPDPSVDARPLRVRVDDPAELGLRARRRDPRSARCSSSSRSRPTIPSATRASTCTRPRPTAPRSRSRSSTARAPSSTARRRCWSTATARTGSRWSRGSARAASACSIAAGSTRSRTSAAARRWAAAWYEDGKLMKKANTFTDFIAATEHLVAKGYGARDQVFAMGGSAGGLLVGAVANLRPELYRGIVVVRAVRRRRHDDARRVDPADHQRVRGVGQPDRRQGGVRLHAVVLAVRQRHGAGLPGDLRAHRAVGQPGPVLRAGEVGREAARDQDATPTRCCSTPT